MKTKTRRIAWTTLLIVVAVVALTLYLTRHQPIARIPLPDGTELRLEYVTYGTEHRMPGAGKIIEWASLEADYRWPRLGISPQVAEYEYRSETPELRLWFTHYDPRAGKFLPNLDRDLAVAGASALEGTPYAVNHQNSFPDDDRWYRETLLPMPHYLIGVGNYERRRPTLHLRVTMQGQTSVLTVPNPAAKMSFPEWKAEPFPQTHRIGKLDLVLRGLRTEIVSKHGVGSLIVSQDDTELSVEPIFEILHDGKPAQGLSISDSFFMDPTGNVGSGTSLPSFSERVWKVQATVLRNEAYPFDEKEGVMFGPVPLPEAEKYHAFAISKEDADQGLRFAALLGPGRYVWRDGVFEEIGPAIADKDAGEAFVKAGSDGDNTLRINATAPAFVMLFLTGAEPAKKKWGKAYENLVRIKCAAQLFGWEIKPGSWENNIPPKYSASSSAVCYQFPNWDSSTTRDATPPGTPVTIQIVPVDRETVEFFVTPPEHPASMPER